MIFYNKYFMYCIIVFLSTTFSSMSLAAIRDFETPRVAALGGAGVASLLINEATFLNPAAIMFFKKSTMHYQKSAYSFENDSDLRATDYGLSDSESLVITDTDTASKGAFSYTYQKENGDRRIRYASSFAQALGRKTAMGLVYRYTMDRMRKTGNEIYHQAVIGFTHIRNKNISLGLAINDPFRTKREQFKVTAGIQYSITPDLLIILDFGTGDKDNPSTKAFTKLGVQFMTFKQLLFRYGQFNDKHENTKGNSWGLSWVGPKFGLDFSYKSFEFLDDVADEVFKEEAITESSLSMTILF